MKLILIATSLLVSGQLRAQDLFRRVQTVEAGVSLLTHNRNYFGLRREINRKFREL